MSRYSFALLLLIASPMALWAPPSIWADEAKGADAESKTPASRQIDDEYYELFKVLVDVMDQVERNYVKDIDRRELMQAAIQGVLSKLDPYSNYIPPEQISRFRTSIDSEFGGIGIQVSVERGQLKVISPLVGTPAYRAGVLAGDHIVKIEGKTTKGITIDEAVRRLKGKAGTEVKFTIVHHGGVKEEEITVRREIVQIETVMGDLRGDDDAWDFLIDHENKIGYIRIIAFSRETARHLRQVVKALTEQEMRGLVIDLRFNPGGLLSSAIEICDMFISEGRIVSTKDRAGRERTWDATAPGTFSDFPMAILVNRYSASASEIFSACLQDHERAVIIGERTWGKGSVQNVVELEGGKSALKLTTASYHRPNGKNIHRFPDAKPTDEWGVMPSEGFRLRLRDSQLAGLVRYRRQRDIVQPRKTPKDADSPVKTKPEPGDAVEAPDADERDADERDAEERPDEKEGEYVDRQLKMALEHLLAELKKES